MFLFIPSLISRHSSHSFFTMPSIFPSPDTLHDAFHSPNPYGRRNEPSIQPRTAPVSKRPTPLQARSELYTAWSVVDDAKNKANALSAEATKEFDKASAAAQAKTGKIELYSPKFYAACTFGGLLACVSYLYLPTISRFYDLKEFKLQGTLYQFKTPTVTFIPKYLNSCQKVYSPIDLELLHFL